MGTRRTLLRALSACIVAVVTMIAACCPVLADSVFLKNGNTLEGAVIGETQHLVFLQLPSGTVRIPKRRVNRIRRDRPVEAPPPTVEELLADHPDGVGTSAEIAVFLCDGRRVDGTISGEQGGIVTINSMYGPVSFPSWMVDRLGVVRRKWRFAKPLEDARSPDLLDELRARAEHFRRKARVRRLGNPEVLQLLDRKAVELGKAEAEKNSSAVMAVARGLAELRYRLEGAERVRALNLALNALRTAAGIERAKGDAGSALTAALYLTERSKLLCAEGSPGAAKSVGEAIRASLQSDPGTWMSALDIIDELEGYAWIAKASDLTNVPWRSARLEIGGAGAESVGGARFLIRRRGGDAVAGAPPDTADGVDSVWIPAMNVAAADPGDGAAWWRIFWCPVEIRWTERTIPEELAQRTGGVYRWLARQLALEREDTQAVAQALAVYDLVLENLATHELTADGRQLQPGARSNFRRATRALRELVRRNELALRRRAFLSPALAYVHRIHELHRDAGEGVQVDLARLGPWKPVADVAEADPDRVVQALSGFHLEARLGTLRGEAIRYLGDSSSVRATVDSLARNPFSLPEERKAAEDLIDHWERR